jgi:hypothetical protein
MSKTGMNRSSNSTQETTPDPYELAIVGRGAGNAGESISTLVSRDGLRDRLIGTAATQSSRHPAP